MSRPPSALISAASPSPVEAMSRRRRLGRLRWSSRPADRGELLVLQRFDRRGRHRPVWHSHIRRQTPGLHGARCKPRQQPDGYRY